MVYQSDPYFVDGKHSVVLILVDDVTVEGYVVNLIIFTTKFLNEAQGIYL